MSDGVADTASSQKDPNRSEVRTDPDGTKTTVFYSEGRVSFTETVKPDETTILFYADGTRITDDKKTGTHTVEHLHAGDIESEVTLADGTYTIKYRDGSSDSLSGDKKIKTHIDPDQTKFVTDLNKNEITTTFTDGTVRLETSHGNTFITKPDGTRMTFWDSGKSEIRDALGYRKYDENGVLTYDSATKKEVEPIALEPDDPSARFQDTGHPPPWSMSPRIPDPPGTQGKQDRSLSGIFGEAAGMRPANMAEMRTDPMEGEAYEAEPLSGNPDWREGFGTDMDRSLSDTMRITGTSVDSDGTLTYSTAGGATMMIGKDGKTATINMPGVEEPQVIDLDKMKETLFGGLRKYMERPSPYPIEPVRDSPSP